ncbi:hypothetical protein D3C87_1871980 [compost metagenome]
MLAAQQLADHLGIPFLQRRPYGQPGDGIMRKYELVHMNMPEILNILLLHNLDCSMYLRGDPLNAGDDQQGFAVNQRGFVYAVVTKYNGRSCFPDAGL